MNNYRKHMIFAIGTVIALTISLAGHAQQDEDLNAYRTRTRASLEAYRNRVFQNVRQYRDSIFRQLIYYRDSLNIPFGRQLQMPWQADSVEQPIVPSIYRHAFTPTTDIPVTSMPVTLPFTRDFYGKKIRIRFPGKTSFHLKDLSEENIGNAWLHLNRCNLVSPICECLTTAMEMQLNDWGIYELIRYLSEQTFPEQARNEKIIFRFFLLNQAGYRCKLVRLDTEELTLLLPFTSPVYYTFYRTYEDVKYYMPDAVSSSPKRWYTYRQDFRNTQKIPDLHIYASPLLGKEITTKTFTSSELTLDLPVNKCLIDFYNSYPRCQPEIYATAALDPGLLAELQRQLSSSFALCDEKGKIDRLLHFMQHAFQYRSDEDYWGQERCFFAEESLYYPYVDCEDLAILFGKLVLSLTSNELLFLASEEHLYTAIHFKNPFPGDRITYREKTYMVCDPAYVDASAGMLLPRCRGKKYHILLKLGD